MPQTLVLILLFILTGCGKKSAQQDYVLMDQMPDAAESEINGEHLKIFSSLSKVDGSAGQDLLWLDSICTEDAKGLGLSGLYKAMVTTSKRRACQSADCTKQGLGESMDWVLAAKTEYRLPDGKTILGETNELALMDFPLRNPLSSSSEKLWTGFSDYWTSPYYSFESCAGLTNNLDTGFVGDASSLNADLLKKSSLSSCKKKYSIICVEQKSSP